MGGKILIPNNDETLFCLTNSFEIEKKKSKNDYNLSITALGMQFTYKNLMDKVQYKKFIKYLKSAKRKCRSKNKALPSLGLTISDLGRGRHKLYKLSYSGYELICEGCRSFCESEAEELIAQSTNDSSIVLKLKNQYYAFSNVCAYIEQENDRYFVKLKTDTNTYIVTSDTNEELIKAVYHNIFKKIYCKMSAWTNSMINLEELDIDILLPEEEMWDYTQEAQEVPY